MYTNEAVLLWLGLQALCANYRALPKLLNMTLSTYDFHINFPKLLNMTFSTYDFHINFLF